MNDDYVRVEVSAGLLEAEIVKAMLESHGIDVFLAHEGAASAIGLTIGPLAQVEVLVPKAQEEEASEILERYHSGSLEEQDD